MNGVDLAWRALRGVRVRVAVGALLACCLAAAEPLPLVEPGGALQADLRYAAVIARLGEPGSIDVSEVRRTRKGVRGGELTLAWPAQGISVEISREERPKKDPLVASMVLQPPWERRRHEVFRRPLPADQPLPAWFVPGAAGVPAPSSAPSSVPSGSPAPASSASPGDPPPLALGVDDAALRRWIHRERGDGGLLSDQPDGRDAKGQPTGRRLVLAPAGASDGRRTVVTLRLAEGGGARVSRIEFLSEDAARASDLGTRRSLKEGLRLLLLWGVGLALLAWLLLRWRRRVALAASRRERQLAALRRRAGDDGAPRAGMAATATAATGTAAVSARRVAGASGPADAAGGPPQADAVRFYPVSEADEVDDLPGWQGLRLVAGTLLVLIGLLVAWAGWHTLEDRGWGAMAGLLVGVFGGFGLVLLGLLVLASSANRWVSWPVRLLLGLGVLAMFADKLLTGR